MWVYGLGGKGGGEEKGGGRRGEGTDDIVAGGPYSGIADISTFL